MLALEKVEKERKKEKKKREKKIGKIEKDLASVSANVSTAEILHRGLRAVADGKRAKSLSLIAASKLMKSNVTHLSKNLSFFVLGCVTNHYENAILLRTRYEEGGLSGGL